MPQMVGTLDATYIAAMIRANCRASFSAEDFAFIVSVLSRNQKSAVSLTELLADEETRDTILDHETLLRAVLEHNGTVAISAHLFFYVVTRHVLCNAGIRSREICDYIASLLAAFSVSAKVATPVDSNGGNPVEFHYLSDVLLALKQAPSARQAFLLRAHIGNYALFLSGMFHDRIECRAKRGAPDCSFYERMGMASFRDLSTNPVARQCRLDDVYGDLGEHFHDVRLALNRLSSEVLSMEEQPPMGWVIS